MRRPSGIGREPPAPPGGPVGHGGSQPRAEQFHLPVVEMFERHVRQPVDVTRQALGHGREPSDSSASPPPGEASPREARPPLAVRGVRRAGRRRRRRPRRSAGSATGGARADRAPVPRRRTPPRTPRRRRRSPSCRRTRLMRAVQYSLGSESGGDTASARMKSSTAVKPTGTPCCRSRTASATANAARSTPGSNADEAE